MRTTAGASVARSADRRLQTTSKANRYGFVSFVIRVDVRFSNRQIWVKRLQTTYRHNVDVTRVMMDPASC